MDATSPYLNRPIRPYPPGEGPNKNPANPGTGARPSLKGKAKAIQRAKESKTAGARHSAKGGNGAGMSGMEQAMHDHADREHPVRR